MSRARWHVVTVMMVLCWAAPLLYFQFVFSRDHLIQSGFSAFFWPFGAMIFLAFSSTYLLLRRIRHDQWIWGGMGLGIAIRVVFLFSSPTLSDDYHRYLWDGNLTQSGVNPFSLTPEQWLNTQKGSTSITPELQTRFRKLNSKQFYSVYPPPLQAIFYLAAIPGPEQPFWQCFFLKFLVFLAELGTFWGLALLAKKNRFPRWVPLLYFLNPWVIMELSGNSHSEAFMILGLVWGIFWIEKGNIWGGAIGWAFAIGAKLIPIFIIPLTFRFLGFKKSLLLVALTGLFLLLAFAPLFSLPYLGNFRESLQLYFKYFEFNGGIYEIWWHLAGYHIAKSYFWILPSFSIAGICLLFFWDNQKKTASLAALCLTGLTLYQLTATTIHPWYLTPLAGLAVLTPYRFSFLWLFFSSLSYVAYFLPEFHLPGWFMFLEYGALFFWISYEWVLVRPRLTLESWAFRTPLLRKWLKKTIPSRLALKMHRILPHLPRGESILDLGTGHGGVAHGLVQNGYTLQAVDVKNISLFPEITPLVYDGEKLPFPNQKFDNCLLITVLHHCSDPSSVLGEAKRTTQKRIIVMEDIYSNPLQRQLTFWADSLVNLEFEGHPHTNKSGAGWKEEFERQGLELIHEEEFRTLLFFRQAIYVLKVPEINSEKA